MISSLLYLLSAFLMVTAIDCLSAPSRVVRGYHIASVSVGIALLTCMTLNIYNNALWILLALFAGAGVGILFALRVQLSTLPQMVALLNGVGGLASALIICCPFNHPKETILEALCVIIGLTTFSGSMVAFAKLHGWLRRNIDWFKWLSIVLEILLLINTVYFVQTHQGFAGIMILALLIGVCGTMPIGGADMPVIISILNSLSGWAVVLVGLLSGDLLLIITGSLVGASGTILSYVMSKSMNRSLLKIIWPNHKNIEKENTSTGLVRTGSVEEAAFIMANSRKVIIVPGFGMAAAHAQIALKNMDNILTEKYGVDVRYAVHPVAGRMPGHINVLLAEAQIPYERIYAMEDINQDFETADAVYVIGANDITNPLAKTDENSPLYGMPILEVTKAKTVFFVKRSLAPGYSGINNPLFYAPNTVMLFGDGKKITEDIVKDLEK